MYMENRFIRADDVAQELNVSKPYAYKLIRKLSVGKFERHIERKNESYENMNVDLSRTPMNVHFQGCGELTYNEHLDRLIADGVVSLKGLKPDATVFNEMILDVNTDYFERNGGYDFACRFYEEAFHFAEKLYGKDNIILQLSRSGGEENIAAVFMYMTEKSKIYGIILKELFFKTSAAKNVLNR